MSSPQSFQPLTNALSHRRDSEVSATSSDSNDSIPAHKFLRLTEEPKKAETAAVFSSQTTSAGAFANASAAMRQGEARELDARVFMLRRFE